MRTTAANQRFLLIVLSVLLLAFVGIGTVQYRQFQDLQHSTSQGEDNVMWNYFQLYNEALRFQTSLLHEPQSKFQLRYDIMVSRMNLIMESKDRNLLQHTRIYQQASDAIHQYTTLADNWLGPEATVPVQREQQAVLILKLETLLPLLHQLTLEVNQQATLFDLVRRDSIRKQIITTTIIATMQFTLLFVLALLIWRQMNISTTQHKVMRQLNEQLTNATREAEAGTRAKSSFLANMSHEIRTPMNGILGMLSLLADREMDPRERDYLNTARESANHLLALLNDILDVSKLEEGKIELQFAPHHLPKLLEDVRSLMKNSCEQKGIGFHLSISPACPEWIMIDNLRVRQILLNLTSNAIKFTHQGEIRIHVDRIGQTSDSSIIQITIQDTGIGMSRSQLEKLFQRFSQADISITRQYGGSGLGLEISRNLARLMGGEITVESQEQVGSQFTFSWPVQLTAPPLAILPSIDKNHGTYRILLVDDNATNRKVLSAMLSTVGHQVSIATQGEEALTLLAHTSFDLILMDVQMPVMDGLAATRAIRESMKPWADIPIIALTADAMPDSRVYYLSHGMDGYLTKPISKQILMNEISHIMCNHRGELADEESGNRINKVNHS